MKKTVLMLAYYFPPLGMGGVQRMSKLAKYLPQHGYDVKVLTVKPIRYPAHDKTLLEELPGSVEVFRSGSTDPARVAKIIPVPFHWSRRLRTVAKNRAGFWPDAKIGWKKAAVKLGREILSKGKTDILLSSSPPITGHLVAMELAGEFGLPWVADFRDIWESRPPEQLYRDKSLIDRSNKLLRNISEKAKAVTAINETIAKRLAPAGIVIRGGFDPDDLADIESNPKPDRFVVCYLGTVGSLHPLEPFFEAARMASEKEPDFARQLSFRIIGANDQHDIVQKASNFKLQDKIELIDYLPHRESLARAAESDVMLLSVPAGYEDIMTGKIFDLMALKAPLLASVPIPGEAQQLINSYQGGICVAPHQIDKLAEKMLLLIANKRDGIPWQKRDLSGLTRNESARQFAELFDRIISGGREGYIGGRNQL